LKEIKKYAVYIGLEPKKIRGCLFLAIQGLKTELPIPWILAETS